MGRVTYKIPDKDLFVTFSTISDEPLCWGSTEQMLKWWIKDQFANKFTSTGIFGDNFVEILERAEEYGSSSRIREANPITINWGGHGLITIDKLEQALDLLEAGKKTHSKSVLALVDSWEDDDDSS